MAGVDPAEQQQQTWWHQKLQLEAPPPPGRYSSELAERSMELSTAYKAFLYGAYSLILVLGLVGNLLVCYVVLRRGAMRTVTNMFIGNLALSDILLCLFSVPFTPLYLLHYKQWVFGPVLCRLVPFCQGVSVYVSVLSLMCIAIERYRVIMYPFKRRIGPCNAVPVIGLIWLLGLVLTMPYGIFIDVIPLPSSSRCYCDEVWPSDRLRVGFGLLTALVQFVVPFSIISYCYLRVFLRLSDRIRRRGLRNYSSQRLWLERERAKRTNLMLIAMVAIFAVSWLPLTTYNLIEDLYVPISYWKHSRRVFMAFHLVAMSSVCYNPFLYAWLNGNFHKEFRSVPRSLWRLVCVLAAGKQANSQVPSGPLEQGSLPLRSPPPPPPPAAAAAGHQHKGGRQSRAVAHCELEGGNTTTTNNLVSNLESINELELQESLFVTSLQHNGKLATRLWLGSEQG